MLKKSSWVHGVLRLSKLSLGMNFDGEVGLNTLNSCRRWTLQVGNIQLLGCKLQMVIHLLTKTYPLLMRSEILWQGWVSATSVLRISKLESRSWLAGCIQSFLLNDSYAPSLLTGTVAYLTQPGMWKGTTKVDTYKELVSLSYVLSQKWVCTISGAPATMGSEEHRVANIDKISYLM